MRSPNSLVRWVTFDDPAGRRPIVGFEVSLADNARERLSDERSLARIPAVVDQRQSDTLLKV
jgi:hypothetical protein